MSKSYHVVAYVDNKDKIYQKHSKVLIACLEASVDLPKQTAEYFGSSEAYAGLLEEKLEVEIQKHDWTDGYNDGYEIYVKEIPDGAYKIRFYCSY